MLANPPPMVEAISLSTMEELNLFIMDDEIPMIKYADQVKKKMEVFPNIMSERIRITKGTIIADFFPRYNAARNVATVTNSTFGGCGIKTRRANPQLINNREHTALAWFDIFPLHPISGVKNFFV